MSNLCRGESCRVSLQSLEGEFESLKDLFDGEKGLLDWIEKGASNGGKDIAIRELRRRGFRSLGTDEGWKFLVNKFPCPNAIRKEH